MAEHVGRIPLIRRRRRRPPSPLELVAIVGFAVNVVGAVIVATDAATEHGVWRGVGWGLALALVWQARYLWAPIAIPALKRWWWSE